MTKNNNYKKTILMTSIIAMTFLIGFTANEVYGGVCDEICQCQESCVANYSNDLNVCAVPVVATIDACGEGDNTDAVLQVIDQDAFCIAVGWDTICDNAYFDIAGIGLSDCGMAAVNALSSGLCVITANEDVITCFDQCIPNGEVDIDIDIDIKPGSFPNSINTKSMGVVPVAILGSDSFDVTDVDVTTLIFGPDGASPAHDLTDPDTYDEHLQDVNDDGFLDLVSHYKQKETGIACGNTEAILTAATNDGTPIEGTDSVNPKGC